MPTLQGSPHPVTDLCSSIKAWSLILLQDNFEDQASFQSSPCGPPSPSLRVYFSSTFPLLNSASFLFPPLLTPRVLPKKTTARESLSQYPPSFLAVSKKKRYNDWGCFELESPCDSGSLLPTPWCLTLWPGFWCSYACLSHTIQPNWCHQPSQHHFHPLGSALLIVFPEIPSPSSKFCQFSKLTLSPIPSKKPTKILNPLSLLLFPNCVCNLSLPYN